MNNIRKLAILFGLLLFIELDGLTQAISSVPGYPTINDNVVVRFDINQCTRKDLIGYTGDVYVHSGVYVEGKSNWQHVIADWDVNIEKAKCSRVGTNIYELTITPDVFNYYSISNGEKVTSLNFVVRSSDRSKQTEDLFLTVYEPGLTVEITEPSSNLIVTENEAIQVKARSIYLGTPAPSSVSLYLDDALQYTSSSDTLAHSVVATGNGQHWIKTTAASGIYNSSDSIFYFIRTDVADQDLPEGVVGGINYIDETTVTLVLYAPGKGNVFVIGDFNNWQLDNDYQMIQTPDGKSWWLTISGLTAGEEYAFQYYIDGKLKIADPYTEKVLDPWNDPYIPATTYPNLKAYPSGKTTGIVSVFQTNIPAYNWQHSNFILPGTEDLVIYEIHVQNFTDAGTIRMLKDTLDYLARLGINAVELMPVNEFEGNLSWGYNPSFYFAFDKMYGTKDDFKQFVDACHEKGIAVIIDMVLNHSYSQSPLVQLYWDGSSVTGESPWYNVSCPHSNWCWGYDFNHESNETQYFIDRVNSYWLTEYKIDGFRFDFTKGFTNKQDANAWGPDASRIAILKRMTNAIRSVKDDAIVIFEHLADNAEEKELAEYGILLWGNMNYNYNEATMGYNENNKSNFSGIAYTNRGWDVPALVGYMESHDEERLMYKNLQYGNSNVHYDVKDLATALQRIETAAAFFFTVPGPKMILEWGELGYDYSINTCIDGTVNDCRLDLKPIRWDYYNDSKRYRLNKVFEALIDFKLTEFGKTDDFSYNFSGPLKSIHLNQTAAYATIIGNFGITNGTINPQFQHTGTWYNYLTGESIEVSDVNAEIKLKPGEYHIYIDLPLAVIELPEAPSIPDVTSIRGLNSEQTISIFPNPVSNGVVHFYAEQGFTGETTIELQNIAGKTLKRVSVDATGENQIAVEIGDLHSQLVIYTIHTQNEIIQGKLIIE